MPSPLGCNADVLVVNDGCLGQQIINGDDRPSETVASFPVCGTVPLRALMPKKYNFMTTHKKKKHELGLKTSGTTGHKGT